MADPVEALRAALDGRDEYRGQSCDQHDARLADAAQVLLDALPEMLAKAWDEGVQLGIEYGRDRWCDIREFDAVTPTNPFRRETGDQT